MSAAVQIVQQTVGIEDYNEEIVEVNLFQLVQWKHALHLEQKGLTHSRGSVYQMLRKKLSAPKTFSLDDMSRYIDGTVESINQQLGRAAD